MHPAYSVILFTTSSGAGYGLLFWLGLARSAGITPGGPFAFAIGLFIALVLITIGLLSSTFHLGHPERAWRALSQWRSSWLSREGVVAILTYVPSGLLLLASLFSVQSRLLEVLGLLSAIGAVGTVICTGMIYASLRTIRQWNLALVPAVYLALAAASGALLMALMEAVDGIVPSWALLIALASLVAATALKIAYYREIDSDDGQYTAQMALGIGSEKIRQLDPPHTRPNYVMREMGYQVARKHAHKLRRIVFLALFAAPILAVVLSLAASTAAPFLLILALPMMALGLVVERWLFFAEAVHVSMLYYGLQRA